MALVNTKIIKWTLFYSLRATYGISEHQNYEMGAINTIPNLKFTSAAVKNSQK